MKEKVFCEWHLIWGLHICLKRSICLWGEKREPTVCHKREESILPFTVTNSGCLKERQKSQWMPLDTH